MPANLQKVKIGTGKSSSKEGLIIQDHLENSE